MLRFQPDGWLEGLLRPWLLPDPVAGLYFEIAAPDWRFAAFLVCLVIVVATGRARRSMDSVQALATLGLVLMLWVWTFASGNGRYFIWGLVMIGPLLAMAVRLMPGTVALRATVLGLVACVQGAVLTQSYAANAWGAVPIRHSPLALDESPLRQQPAVFLTMSALSFSALVPHFHPESRWASIGGQHVIYEGSPEQRRLRRLLTSPLPMYLMLPLDRRSIDPQGGLPRSLDGLAQGHLAPYGLALAPAACTFLNSPMSRVTRDRSADGAEPQPGFWFCPLQPRPGGALAVPDPAQRYADVFRQVEQRCPRFFPSGGSRPVLADDSTGVFYPMTDMRLMVDSQEDVHFKYFRAMNPTRLGSAADVRRGAFDLPCSKPPGRYQLPWKRD